MPDACSQTGVQVPPTSQVMSVCVRLRWGEASVAQGCQEIGVDPPQFSSVTLGCWNEQPHGWAWANHKQYTALQDSRDTLLEMVNPSDGDLRWKERKKNKRERMEKKEEEEEEEGWDTEHQVQYTKIYVSSSVLKISFSERNPSRALIHTSFRGRKEAEERQVLVGKWTDTAYFILSISSILLD